MRKPVEVGQAAVTSDRLQDPPFLSVLTGFFLASFTALLGAFLGVIPSAHLRLEQATFWALVFFVAALLCLYAAYICWRRRRTILDERGTAYIVAELGDGWNVVEVRDFEQAVRNHFAHVLVLPSGRDLGEPWNWPRVADRAGEWRSRIDLLANLLIGARLNDDRATGDALFLWSDWPVGAGLGQRVERQLRGSTFELRERPSKGGHGGANIDEGPVWLRPGHLFMSGAQQSAACPASSDVVRRQVGLTVSSGVPCTPGGRPVVFLVARCTSTLDFAGVLPFDQTKSATRPLDLVNGTEIPLSDSADVIEWQFVRHHPFHSQEALAAAVSDFLAVHARAAVELDPSVVLVVVVEVPPDVPYGIGVYSQRPKGQLPTQTYAAIYDVPTQRLVIPGLDLGQRPRVGEPR